MFNFLKRKLHNLISDERFSEILTGSAWALSARVIATGLGLVFSIIVARFYGAETVGIVAVVNSFLMLATIFTILGTNASILHLIPEIAKPPPKSVFLKNKLYSAVFVMSTFYSFYNNFFGEEP